MGFHLKDPDDDSNLMFINFWHWRTIVEAVRRAAVFDAATIDRMHQQCTMFQLSRDQSQVMVQVIEDQLMPQLEENERLLLDGSVTEEEDDGTFHKVELERNYSTNLEVLRNVVAFCRSTRGIVIN